MCIVKKITLYTVITFSEAKKNFVLKTDNEKLEVAFLKTNFFTNFSILNIGFFFWKWSYQSPWTRASIYLKMMWGGLLHFFVQRITNNYVALNRIIFFEFFNCLVVMWRPQKKHFFSWLPCKIARKIQYKRNKNKNKYLTWLKIVFLVF